MKQAKDSVKSIRNGYVTFFFLFPFRIKALKTFSSGTKHDDLPAIIALLFGLNFTFRNVLV